MKVSRDRNHGKVKQALERTGARVFDAAGVGGGFPDLVVWAPRLRRFVLVEVKDGEKKRDDLTPAQREFHRLFAGTDLIVACSPEEALRAIALDVGERAVERVKDPVGEESVHSTNRRQCKSIQNVGSLQK